MEFSPESLSQPNFNPWYYHLSGKLVKKMKPCLPGNHIHIYKWDGCYQVVDVKINHFVIKKNRELISLPWTEFRCLKGEGKSDMSILKRELKALGSSLTGNVFQVYRLLNLLSK